MVGWVGRKLRDRMVDLMWFAFLPLCMFKNYLAALRVPCPVASFIEGSSHRQYRYRCGAARRDGWPAGQGGCCSASLAYSYHHRCCCHRRGCWLAKGRGRLWRTPSPGCGGGACGSRRRRLLIRTMGGAVAMNDRHRRHHLLFNKGYVGNVEGKWAV